MNIKVAYKQLRITRVICKYKIGDSYGTGFFISKDGKMLTCFHVVFGQELRMIKNNPDFISISGGDEHSKLLNFYKNKISTLEVELHDGQKKEAELLNFDERYDIALLKVKMDRKVDFFKVDTKNNLNYGDDIFFCGYQLTTGYNVSQYPFTVNSGLVSSFPDVIVGGEKYGHIQINSINLGGNSGAPVFLQGSNKVVAIINGIMNWNNNNVAIVDDSKGNMNLSKGSIITPLSIAFATRLKTIKENTNIFN